MAFGQAVLFLVLALLVSGFFQAAVERGGRMARLGALLLGSFVAVWISLAWGLRPPGSFGWVSTVALAAAVVAIGWSLRRVAPPPPVHLESEPQTVPVEVVDDRPVLRAIILLFFLGLALPLVVLVVA